ncbi:uncharacterized protein LOC128987522 [Macrosteles quadrilineatus]|uniref:uncharacterized protein LOC128987522 n=1 Tax=Macrosteles quadrilineatus TaxID=74068 RepID=UPI0023E199BC|nr:uncharacterized protein LOC128987522 [Macrosteles quadrilineatus]
MSSKRSSDEPVQSGGKRPRLESENEESNDIKETLPVPIKSKYYPPKWIFRDKYTQDGDARVNEPEGMAGTNNSDLATIFYHSRYTREDIQGTSDRMNRYSCNAGALQLYEKDGRRKYTIPGKEEVEYNAISYPIEDFNGKPTTLGHVEKILMLQVLDDFIEADSGKSGIPPRPSDYKDDTNTQHDYKVLNNLTEKASEYKQYLKSKDLIVKMWSERQACDKWKLKGEACSKFIEDICPEGSQYGYIVELKSFPSMKVEKREVKKRFTRLKNAYLKYSKNRS